MPDYKARKRRLRGQAESGREELEKRGLRGSGEDPPPARTRGERKKQSLDERRIPIEQGGD